MIPPIFKTSRYSLEPYKLEDEDRFIEMALDAVSVQFMGGSTGDEAAERLLFKKIFEVYKRTDKRWFWLWGIYKENVLCGHLEMKETEHTKSDELEIVYMVHPQERRKGLMTEILEFLKEHQSNWQRKIIATVSPTNTTSIALLKKWGIAQTETILEEETGESYLKLTLQSFE